jgi:prepilin signal peptidase PulO-like enzyme (type II secretory pathway)
LALLFGSFTNVLIYRIPANLSVLSPGSYCPECKHSLSILEKIPLVSFMIQQGKCSKCQAKIPWHYPLVELVLVLIAYPFISYSQSLIEFMMILIILSLVTAQGVIDEKNHKLPLALSYIGIVLVSFFTSTQGSLFFELDPSFAFLKFPAVARFANFTFQLGLTMFCLDFLVHLSNKLFFKNLAERITSSALFFRISFLEKNAEWYYLAIFLTLFVVFYISGLDFVKIIFAFIGASYLVNEIILDYFVSPKILSSEDNSSASELNAANPTSSQNDNDTRTVLGGGDIAFLGLISVVSGAQAAFFILIMSFYLIFLKLLFDKIFCLASKKTFVLNASYPMGLALAIIFIADMMNMVYRKSHLFAELLRLLELN